MNDPGNTLDQAVDQLYDPIIALQRQALDIEREYRDLAQRDDLAVDTLGAPTTPAEAIASITEALASLRDTLRADRRAEWWRRLSWAFDHSLSSDPDEVDFGWLMIEHLAASKLATSDDTKFFQAVAERWVSGDTEATPNEGGRL